MINESTQAQGEQPQQPKTQQAQKPAPPQTEKPKTPVESRRRDGKQAPSSFDGYEVECTRWRLGNEIKVSLHGNMITMPAGHVVSLQAHGRDGIDRIITAGGKLIPLEA